MIWAIHTHEGHNRLCNLASIAHLALCPKLGVIDLSHNNIDEEDAPDTTIDFFGGLPELKVCLEMGSVSTGSSRESRMDGVLVNL